MDVVQCRVDCWADFGDFLSGRLLHCESEVLITSGTNELLLFSTQEKRVKTILRFNCPVKSVALSDDQSRLYVLCQNSGVYCTKPSLESSSQSQKSKTSDDCTVSIISTDSVVIEDGKVQSFLLVDDILVTVSLQESFWSFNLYKVPNCSAGATIYHKHLTFQVPAVTASIPQNTGDARIDSVPVLTCIYPSKDSSTSKEQSYQHHLFLEPLLFRLLFGIDASLVHSPVIVCGLPDGGLFFFPLHLPAVGEQKSRIRMLHSLQQPVTFIGTSATGGQGPQCLVVIGQMGQILLIKAQSSSDGKAADCSFIEQTVRGPVVCACVDGERLYYSTSTNLLAVPLNKTSSSSSSSSSLTTAERPGISAERSALLSQSAVSLSVCRVIALAKPSITPTGCVLLLALTLNGRLLQVTLPHESDKDSVSRLTSSQVGQTVKDLLAGIGNIWERASSLKHQLQLKNNILRRLNQVMYICNLLLSYQKRDQEGDDCKPPISCHAVTNWSTLLQKDTLVLTCSLENLCNCSLGQGWTLCVEVQSPHCISTEPTSRTYSFALKKLDCGKKMEVSLPLENRGGVFFPLKIHCFLCYSIQSLLYPEDSRHLSASDVPVSHILQDKNCISLALNTITLDWLDSLQIGESTSHGEIPKQNTTWEAIHLFLGSRRIHTEDQPVPKAGHLAAAIRVSSELLRNRLGFHDCSSAALCVSVLKWLFSGTSEAKTQLLVESPVLSACGPNGQSVRLLTKEVILSDISSEGPLSVVEVQVESCSIAAVCGLHHAVLRRVQVLFKDAPVKCLGPAKLKGQILCEAVQLAESLYKDLKNSHASAIYGGVNKTRTSESLLHLYLKLRENPLVIL